MLPYYPVSFSSLLGQPTAKTTLEHALTSGRVHHAYRFVGPPGVGKETAAFLLAQALLCTEGDTMGCGSCSACKRASTLSTDGPEIPKHPDVLLIGRQVYPSDLIGGASESSGISVEQIRRILMPRVRLSPHEGRAMVVIIRDADQLNISSANALLKTLEEPKPGVHFILLTSRPAQLLDTILSRTLAIRFGPLPDEVVGTLLAREGVSPEVASLAGGSLTRARILAEPEGQAVRDHFVQALDEAISAGHAAAATYFGDQRPDARGDLVDLLGHAASVFSQRAKEQSDVLLWAERHEILLRSIREIERNGSPGLVLESMVNQITKSCS